jgi:ADP-ribose pyrophosphatase YjhB (NUDIX family)
VTNGDARAAFASAIAGSAPPERYRILDAGCGPGRDARWFAEAGFQVIGVDRSAGMLAEARRRAPGVEFRQGDLRQLDFPDSYFDGIWCSAALLHLSRSDVPGVLASFNRILGHGYLWLSVKAGQGEGVSVQPYGPDNPRHYTYFSRHEIELYLERAGFHVREVVEDPVGETEPHPFMSMLAQTRLQPPLMGAVAIIFDEAGRVLMSERADGYGWNLPAGFVDRNEGPDDAAVREAREETGLEVEIERLVGIAVSQRHDIDGRAEPRKLISHSFLCRLVGGALVPTNEALQHGWFPPDALPTPMASQRHVHFLRDAIALREGKISEPVLRHYDR